MPFLSVIPLHRQERIMATSEKMAEEILEALDAERAAPRGKRSPSKEPSSESAKAAVASPQTSRTTAPEKRPTLGTSADAKRRKLIFA